MRIAIVGNGVESLLNFRESLIRRLVAGGHEVVAFAPDYDSRTRAHVLALGARPASFALDRGGASPAADLRTLATLRTALARERLDAALCYFMKPAIYGNLAAWMAGVPRRVVMLEGLGYGFAGGRGLKPWLVARVVRLLLRLSLSRARTVLVLNDEDRATLVNEVGVDDARVINMGGIGVELDRFDPAPAAVDPTTFVMAARLIREKGVADFVDAARRVTAVRPQTRFVLLGDIDDNPGSHRREDVTRWVEEGVIEWPGRVDDVRPWLHWADVFVLPSFYREGVPRSIQEAMAAGRAIVTTDHVGCRDTVVPGRNGYLVPPRDPAALAAALLRLVDEPGLAQAMGRASRSLAEERFDAARADARIIALLTSDA